MASENENLPDRVTLTLESGQVVVTLDDGARIQEALANYLATVDPEEAPVTPQHVRNGSIRIDGDGILRIGAWLLEAPLGSMVLTRARTTGNFRQIWVAELNRADDEWHVTGLDQNVYPLRR